MKKISMLIIVILLFVFIACVSSVSQTNSNEAMVKKTDVERDGLKGKVKEWVWLCYNIKDNKKLLSLNHTKKYDEKGNILGYSIYSYEEKKVFLEETYEYDKKGNKVEKISLDKIRNSRWVSKYDTNGNVIEEAMYYAGALYCKTTYKYDKKGNCIEEIYSEKDQKDIKYNYKYDENGNLIEMYIDGVLNYKYNYKYDENGNMTEKTIIEENGTLCRKYNYKYDENGNKIEEIESLPDETVYYKMTYTYDDKGNKIEETFTAKEEHFKYTFKYDENVNCIEENVYEGNKLIEYYETQITYWE